MEKFQSKDGDNMLDHMELEARVLRLMQGMVEQYQDGKIGMEQLETTRDAQLRAVGLYVVTKKPNSETVTQTSLHTPPPQKQMREEGEKVAQYALKWMQELRVMPPLDPLDEVEQALAAVANLADNAMMKV